MQKIKFITDSPSDIPDALLKRYDISMAGVPIAVDGKGYFERRSFTIGEFYDILGKAKDIPTTSRVPAADYAALYKRAWEDGCTDVVNVTINGKGSGTHESARMAEELFYREVPGAGGKMAIHLLDSKTYSMAYGIPVVEGARMAEAGRPVSEILDYLTGFFDRMEIYLVCYTLDYARKSGRITAAAALVGDVLGLRPVIAMIDGTTKTVEKVRGDRAVPQRLLEIFRRRCEKPEDMVCIISAAEDSYGQECQALFERELGREIPHHKAGASIVINSGPKIAAICLLGKKRG